jgi:hypothetical protein
MTKELKLKKQVPDSVNIAGIIPIRGGKAIGIIYICGNFVPVDGCELNTDELKQILTISENFFLFYNNLT